MDKYVTKAAQAVGGTAGALSRGSKSVADTVKEHKVLGGIILGTLAAGTLYFLHKRADRLKSRMDVIIEDYVPPMERSANVSPHLAIPVETSSKRTYGKVRRYLDEVHKAVPYGTEGKTELLSFIGSCAVTDDDSLRYWLREDRKMRPLGTGERPAAFKMYLEGRAKDSSPRSSP